jgi:hypothetical protein
LVAGGPNEKRMIPQPDAAASSRLHPFRAGGWRRTKNLSILAIAPTGRI